MKENTFESKLRNISFEALKKKIKKELRTYTLITQKPGEYLCDRMLQMLGKQEHGGDISIYDIGELTEQIRSIIDSIDIRSIGDLLDFCKKTGTKVPSWLYKGYTIDLTDKGWFIFEQWGA